MCATGGHLDFQNGCLRKAGKNIVLAISIVFFCFKGLKILNIVYIIYAITPLFRQKLDMGNIL